MKHETYNLKRAGKDSRFKIQDSRRVFHASRFTLQERGFSTWIAVGIIAALLAVAGGFAYWYFFAGQTPPTQQQSAPASSAQNTAAQQPRQTATTTAAGKTYLTTEVFTATTSPEEYKGEKITVVTEPEKLPESTKFKSFAYDQTIGKTISVSGSCTDAYYTIVMFRAADDYKKNPAAAVFNQAFACPASRAFSQRIDVKKSNLPSGQYYFFVADQGNAGTWYNPR